MASPFLFHRISHISFDISVYSIFLQETKWPSVEKVPAIQDGRALCSMFYKGLLAVAARSQSCHVLLDLLLIQRVEEDQRQNDAHKANDGGDAGHVEDAAGDSGVKRSRFGVADDPQQGTDQTGREGLTQLAGEGVDRVDGAVLADAAADLGRRR